VTITPAILLWPTNGDIDWATVTYQPLIDRATTITVRSDGSFTFNTQMPNEPPETQVVYFGTENGSWYGEVSIQTNAIFGVLPSRPDTLSLSADSATPSSTVTLSGTNWPVNQTIRVFECPGPAAYPYCDFRDSIALATARSDAAGRIRAAITIPANVEPGLITIQVEPLASPFDLAVYTQTRPFMVLYPFAQAHPRLEMALKAAPYAAGVALLAGAFALAYWVRRCRAANRTVTTQEIE
jgi:hypothetical protein